MFAIFFILLAQNSFFSAIATSDCDNGVRLPSLYEQYCCRDSYRGQNIILTTEHSKETYLLCPPETPASCSSFNFTSSCSDILRNHPNAESSGYYDITLANGTVITVYCDMEGVNCDGEGGWMRVAYLNMSDPSEHCPPGFTTYEQNDTRACGRQSIGCQSVTFPSYDISYTRVCGRVTGYQIGSTDALKHAKQDIDLPYIDGVSITRGNPRKHVWTFIAALQENFVSEIDAPRACPCAPNNPLSTQSFVGNDYFCESGAPGEWENIFYTADPLWDGKQCGLIEEACCNVTGIPWFNKALQQPTTDYIELRVCGSSSVSGEDSPVGYYEIFVK